MYTHHPAYNGNCGCQWEKPSSDWKMNGLGRAIILSQYETDEHKGDVLFGSSYNHREFSESRRIVIEERDVVKFFSDIHRHEMYMYPIQEKLVTNWCTTGDMDPNGEHRNAYDLIDHEDEKDVKEWAKDSCSGLILRCHYGSSMTVWYFENKDDILLFRKKWGGSLWWGGEMWHPVKPNKTRRREAALRRRKRNGVKINA